MTSPRLEMKNISKTFHGEQGDLLALDGLSFALMPGEFVTVIGPSGSGKSSIFNLITGLLQPDQGKIRINGKTPQNRTGLVGYMPQRDLLLPWRTVLGNLIIPMELSGVSRQEAQDQAREMLPRFGLEGFADHYPSALSGGMRQRAALLRTLLTGRDTLLLDEPFGALDALTRRELQGWLLDLWRETSNTILFITHDVEEALYLSDRVIVLSGRPGRVIAIHTVDLPRPRRRSMLANPIFGQQMGELLELLGVVG